MAKIIESFDETGELLGSFFADPDDPLETMQFILMDANNDTSIRVYDQEGLTALRDFIDSCLEALKGKWPEQVKASRKKECNLYVLNGKMDKEAVDKLADECGEDEEGKEE